MTEKNKKISHSAWQKYLTCPYMYKAHYIDRLRPETVSSNLTFGSAVDDAINNLLETGADPVKTFQTGFTYKSCQDVEFEIKDYQPELFTASQLKKLQGKSQHYHEWANFRIKGRLLLETFRDKIYPQIKRVISVQKETTSRPGFIDCILELDDDGPILCDVKTARRPYKGHQTADSTQLALYASDQGISRIAFIVLVKSIKINKVCTKCGYTNKGTSHRSCNNVIDGSRCHGQWEYGLEPPIFQILVDNVNDILVNNVQESMSQCEKSIAAGHFQKNLGACGNLYGKPCAYINHCWKNDNTGLKFVKETIKKEIINETGTSTSTKRTK